MRVTFTNETDLTPDEQQILFDLMGEFNERARDIVSRLNNNADNDNPEKHKNVLRNAGLELLGNEPLYSNVMQPEQTLTATLHAVLPELRDRILTQIQEAADSIVSAYNKETENNEFSIHIEDLEDDPSSLSITVRGPSGHAGMTAHDKNNAFNLAFAFRQRMQEIVSSFDKTDENTLCVEMDVFGEKPESGIEFPKLAMAGTLRTMTPDLEKKAKDRMQTLKDDLIEKYNECAGKDILSIRIDYPVSAPATVNSKQEALALRQAAESILGTENVHDIVPLSGSEDFGRFTGEEGFGRGAMMFVGQGNPDYPNTQAGLHTGEYESNVGIIDPAARIFIQYILQGGHGGDLRPSPQ